MQSTSFLTAYDCNHRRNRRGGANANQGQGDSATPGFRNAIGYKQSNAERQCRAGADDEAEQWGIQDEVHASLHV